MSARLSLRGLLCVFAAIHIGTLAWSQTDADTLSIDTVRNRYLPTGIRAGFDVLSYGRTRFLESYRGWEFEGDVDFNRYYLTLEVGNSGRNLASDSATYANNGDYWRVGIDVNFLTRDIDRNVFFLGARYGKASFTESMTIMRHDEIWGFMSDNFYHTGVKASWVELTTGLRVKIWKIFWMGYTGRLKFALSTKGSPEMLSYDVPGYGRTDKETTWGFNYYVMIRIPVRKAPPPPPEKRKR